MKLQGYNGFTADIALISYDEEIQNTALRAQYLAWLNDMEVVAPILSPVLSVPNKGMEIIDDSFNRFTKENAQGFFIKHLPTDIFIGTIKLDSIDFAHKSAELGIMIGEKSYWGKGTSQQACLILMKYAFENLKLNRVWGGTSEKNIAMQKLFLKCGFKEEGRLRETTFTDNTFLDNYRYSILQKEWLNG